MFQIWSQRINHLIINVFLTLGIKAGIDSLPFAIFVVQNKEKWIYKNPSALYAPDWELSFNVRIATQTMLSKVVKVVQVNNATDANIARSVLLPITHTKPICPASIPKSLNWPKRDWASAVRNECWVLDLSVFIHVYSLGILSVVLLVVEV